MKLLISPNLLCFDTTLFGLPWWSSVSESTFQCCGGGGMDSISVWGAKTSHALGDPSPNTLEPVLCKERKPECPKVTQGSQKRKRTALLRYNSPTLELPHLKIQVSSF